MEYRIYGDSVSQPGTGWQCSREGGRESRPSILRAVGVSIREVPGRTVIRISISFQVWPFRAVVSTDGSAPGQGLISRAAGLTQVPGEEGRGGSRPPDQAYERSGSDPHGQRSANEERSPWARSLVLAVARHPGPPP